MTQGMRERAEKETSEETREQVVRHLEDIVQQRTDLDPDMGHALKRLLDLGWGGDELNLTEADLAVIRRLVERMAVPPSS